MDGDSYYKSGRKWPAISKQKRCVPADKAICCHLERGPSGTSQASRLKEKPERFTFACPNKDKETIRFPVGRQYEGGNKTRGEWFLVEEN